MFDSGSAPKNSDCHNAEPIFGVPSIGTPGIQKYKDPL
jgi:hypothetical protein